MRKLLTGIFLIVATASWSQVKKDSILINERTMDRPLTLHKGQLRITGSYGLGIITKRFDENGDKIELSKEGLATVRHSMLVEIKYGIFDFLEFQTIIGRQGQAIREQNTLELSDPTVITTTIHEYSGMEDIYLGINGRLPLKTKKIDLAFFAGTTVPTAKSEPDVPSHSLIRTTDEFGEVMNVEYRNNYNLGNGVPVVQLGGQFKYRMQNMALSALATHRHGLAEGDSYDWLYQIDDDDNFEYRKDPYTYQLQDKLNGYVELEYQPRPWLNIFANVSGFFATKGWIEKDGVRSAVPDVSLIAINPGVEILITPKLWFRQKIQIPVAGESYESTLLFLTTISYNFFPF